MLNKSSLVFFYYLRGELPVFLLKWLQEDTMSHVQIGFVLMLEENLMERGRRRGDEEVSRKQKEEAGGENET